MRPPSVYATAPAPPTAPATWPGCCMAPPRRLPAGHDSAVLPGLAAGRDRRAAGLRPCHRASLDPPLQPGRGHRAGRPTPQWRPAAGQPPAGCTDRSAAGRTQGVDDRPALPAPGPSCHVVADPAPVGARGRLLAAAPPGRQGRPRPRAGLGCPHQAISELPTGAVVLAEDETHINLLPWVCSTWIPHGQREEVMTPGKNRRRTIFGASTSTPAGGSTRSPARRSASPSVRSASICWPPTQPRPWWRWSATTSSSTTPRSSSGGWHPTRGCGCCTGRPTAPTTTRWSGSGVHSRRGWPTPRP
jgi:hypothetical protein